MGKLGSADPSGRNLGFLGFLWPGQKKNGKGGGGLPERPEAQEFGEAIREAQPGLIGAREQEVGEQYEADLAGQEKAEELSGRAQRYADQGFARYSRMEEDVISQGALSREAIDESRVQVEQLPQQVQTAVDSAISDFKGYTGEAISANVARAEEITSQVMQGQSMAMASAVQGVQGNINNQIAQINSNPDIPAAQKQQMINQVRIGGSMQMGPIIGANILAFNQLKAETATNLNSQITSTVNQAVASMGALEQTGMTQMGGAFQASAQLGSALTQMEVNSRHTMNAERLQLNSERDKNEWTNNQLQLALLPERDDPVAFYSDVMMDDLSLTMEAMRMDGEEAARIWGMDTLTYQYELARADARKQMFSQLLGDFGKMFGPLGETIGTALPLLGG